MDGLGRIVLLMNGIIVEFYLFELLLWVIWFKNLLSF